MKLWNEDPLRKKATIFALVLHLIVLAFVVSPSADRKKKSPSTIVVRTIQAPLPSVTTATSKPAQKSKPVAAPTKAPAKPSSPAKKEVKPVPPKVSKESPKPIAKKVPEKKPIPKPKPAPVKADPKPSKDLQKSLEKIEETIAKIASKGDTIPVKPSQIVIPEIALELDCLSEEEEYISSIVRYLQTHLELPDMGEVKVDLTLRRDGSVEKVKVLSAESERNKKRLEEELPHLCFPPFSKGAQGMKTKGFILTFCNEI